MKKLLIYLSTILFSITLLTSCQSLQGLIELYGSKEHDHVWSKWVTVSESTCSKVGIKERTCECGAKETQNLTPLIHKTGGWVYDQNPTCTEDGARHQYCIVCNTVLETDPISTTGHKAGAWITEKESTCTEDGAKYLSCTQCNQAIETQSIPAEHKEGVWIIDKESTCTEKGSKHFECTICNAILESQEVELDNHIESDWIIDKEASCTLSGSRHKVCILCNVTIKEEIIKNYEHFYIVDKNATSGKVGSHVVFKCTRCVDTYEEAINELSISVKHTGTSSSTVNGYGSFSKSYIVTVTGGYGKYQYKYEVYKNSEAKNPMSHLTKDYSYENQYGLSYRGYEDTISGYVLKVTVIDEAGNQAEFLYTL